MSDDVSVFKVGDLVKWAYDLFEYYEYIFDQEPESGYPFHGIVVGVQQDALQSDKYGYSRLYTVRCFDGHLRYFACWELRLLSTSS